MQACVCNFSKENGMTTEQPRRRVRDMFGSRRVLLAFGAVALLLFTLIGFVVSGLGRGASPNGSVPGSPTAVNATAHASSASRSSESGANSVSTTPQPAEKGMPVRGVSPENALQLPWAYYYDGSDKTIGAKVFSGPEMKPEQEVKLGPNSWILLAPEDRVEVLENLEHETVRVRILTNKYDGGTAGVIGREVYVKGG